MKSTFTSLTVLFLYGCAPKQEIVPPIPSLPVINIVAGSVTTYKEYPAAIEGAVDVEVRPQVSGILDKIFVDEGSFVKAGDALFKINELPYRAQLNNSLAGLHAAESAIINSQLEIEKLTPLVENKVVADYQLKAAKATNEVAKANIEQQKAYVAAARINLGYTLIKAPVSGFIGRLMKKQGTLVSAADITPLTQLSDVHSVHAYFALGETDFVNFKDQYPGLTLKDKLKQLPDVSLMLADGKDYTSMGKVDMIDGQFDKNTGAITLRATFKNENGLLRSGNTGKIKLSLIHANAVIVPQSATIDVQDKVFVFLVSTQHKVKKQAITIISKSGSNYLVKDGIKEGDRIVLSGFDNLQEGTVIHPLKSVQKVAQN